jgi:lactobin A/cerein 7B family class IIb bacteriocin
VFISRREKIGMSLKNNIVGFNKLDSEELKNINGGCYPLVIIGALAGIAIRNRIKK